ncbi:hypothetical protein B0H67DRAFT_480549 [Lasiosphaeris hirsuta]|uniref:Uncharacterized protein n=1 Tax=Lasiosphaeris hirsuta TaxID=260670 RepID=A0AA40AYD2_9PEZI|nr:hypothetical protein B0H67DRAFT_480549 [Lasiosphaeris hirsuta]
MFGEPCVSHGRYGVKDDAAISSWLKEKHFIFAHDERCRFTFDIGTLASLGDLRSVESVFEAIGQFARDLRTQGGFFFFRESYDTDGLGLLNKIYNGTNVFSCSDGFREALPRISETGKSFSEEIAEVPPPWGDQGDERLLRVVLEARKEASKWGCRDPNLHVTYHYKGEPQRDYSGGRPTGVVVEDGIGNQTIVTEGCDVYKDPHLKAPWRRLWYHVDEDSAGDSSFWTLTIMAPAFFYHKDGRARKELDELIAPLHKILPTLSATLLMIGVRIVEHWTEISEYVEQFIAGRDTFLHEKRHDQLLFDDDSFTRSRQYSWVITSTGEFILMINKTISHYESLSKRLFFRRNGMMRKHRKLQAEIEAVRDVFDMQRTRATDLREGLFSASAVVESRLSTRLSQNVRLLTYVSIFYLPLAFCAVSLQIPHVITYCSLTIIFRHSGRSQTSQIRQPKPPSLLRPCWLA